MDSRYDWPPKAPPTNGEGQHATLPPQAHPSYTYTQAYTQSQPALLQPSLHTPIVAGPQILNQNVSGFKTCAQPSPHSQAQRTPIPVPQIGHPRIRQVQVQVPRQRAVSWNHNGVSSNASPLQRPSNVASTSKPVQTTQSSQENAPRPQQRTGVSSPRTHNHHKVPLQPQGQFLQAYKQQQQPHTPSAELRPHQHQLQTEVIPDHDTYTTGDTLRGPSRISSAPLPVEYVVLLLSAADEYISAARNLGSLTILSSSAADLNQYYKLMSAAMGLMETVLRKCTLTPRDEADLRFRYAGLLVEETDNDQEIEGNLAKIIALCNRNRFLDLKYATMHLQARYQFRSNHRGSLKSIDQAISEAETFRHVAWIYAFRFLKVSLALQIPGRPETTSALQQLHAIAAHAQNHSDRAIFVICSVLEAMIHLRSNSLDRLEYVRRAIASARSLQLQTSAENMDQLVTMVDCIDVACCLQHGQVDAEKLTLLQMKADQDFGRTDGSLSVLIEQSSGGKATSHTGGIFSKGSDGKDMLVFAWLPRHDFKTLVYYLSGLVSLPHNRGISYLQEGHRLTQASLQARPMASMSITASLFQRNWIKILDWHIKFAMGLVACFHEDKATAAHAVTLLKARISKPPFNNSDPYTRMLTYLSGVAEQFAGSLASAVSIYENQELSLSKTKAGWTDFRTDIAILALMNRLLIIRSPKHPDHGLGKSFLTQLQLHCTNHPNLLIECAFRILQAISDSEESISRQRTLLHTTANRAQQLKNQQFMAICLNYLASRFFVDQVGDRPISAARAARNVSNQGRSSLWRAVGCGVFINMAHRNGLSEEARTSEEFYEGIKHMLPQALRGDSQDKDAVGDDDDDMIM